MHIATATDAQMCEACCKIKAYKMYVLQTGDTAWICDDCRNGKSRQSLYDNRKLK